MSRILIRAGKIPYQPFDVYDVLKRNLVASNTGNILFAHSVYKALSAPRSSIKVNRYKADPAEASRINEEYDAFVIPLANAFRPSFMKQLELLTGLVEKLKIPCVVVGVGAQTNLRLDLLKESPIDKTVKRFAKAILDRSAKIGVRGEITREYLNKLGFDAVETIGCPSMYLNGPSISIKKDSIVAFKFPCRGELYSRNVRQRL